MTNLGILQGLVFEPRKAFAEIAERPRYWFPLLLLVVATAGVSIWYTSVVDLGWVTDRQLHHSAFARNLTEDQITQMVDRARNARVVSIISQAVIVPILIAAILLISALYDLLVGKIVNFERSFRQWFSFTAWVAAPPALLGGIVGAVVLATTHSSEIPQEALKPLSLNALFFHRAMGDPGFTLFSSLDLFQLATLYLSLVGVKLWSGRSWLFALLFVGIPWVLVYGVWALISLR